LTKIQKFSASRSWVLGETFTSKTDDLVRELRTFHNKEHPSCVNIVEATKWSV